MEGDITIEVFNSIGKLLRNRTVDMYRSEKINLDISDYNTGLLLIKIQYNGDSKILKVIKN
jgi:hypothetical protein